MSPSRERSVTEAFVSLADSLVRPFDVIDMLEGLTERCATLLDVASAGLLLADPSNVLHVLAASSARTRSLELFQLQRDEGPCLDCYRTGDIVKVADLTTQEARWPQFVAAAHGNGFVSVHALPLRLHDRTLGAIGLFGTTIGALNEEDLALGQALAHVASVALVTGSAAIDRNNLNRQLQTALDSRVFIEQAKGAIAQHANVDMDQAFALLRRYSRDNNLKLTDVAAAIASRVLAIQAVSGPRSSTPARRPNDR